MLDFKSPSLNDSEWVKQILSLCGGPGSEDTFSSIFVWQDAFNTKILKYGDFLLKFYEDFEEKIYGFPVGRGDLAEIVNILIKDAGERNIPFVFGGITENKVKFLNEIMPDKFNFIEERDREDYIYNSENLINLKGKKYHSKRNHISKFNRLYKWSYEDISDNNTSACKEFIEKWFSENLALKRSDMSLEKKALERAFSNYNELELVGGVIYIDGQIVALTMGEKINDEIFDVHFEKALLEYNGLYAAINNEFAKRRLYSYHYINREEDMGIPGLRKVKSSYHPVVLLKRYRAEYKN
ncbi:MAG: hypothetical protein RUMPE_00605 [Eubacteriales bacterium SKADARSKE-1]|nr:hypothetical protein [Eubacteriales bacterium SKADARSKE-1]